MAAVDDILVSLLNPTTREVGIDNILSLLSEPNSELGKQDLAFKRQLEKALFTSADRALSKTLDADQKLIAQHEAVARFGERQQITTENQAARLQQTEESRLRRLEQEPAAKARGEIAAQAVRESVPDPANEQLIQASERNAEQLRKQVGKSINKSTPLPDTTNLETLIPHEPTRRLLESEIQVLQQKAANTATRDATKLGINDPIVLGDLRSEALRTGRKLPATRLEEGLGIQQARAETVLQLQEQGIQLEGGRLPQSRIDKTGAGKISSLLGVPGEKAALGSFKLAEEARTASDFRRLADQGVKALKSGPAKRVGKGAGLAGLLFLLPQLLGGRKEQGPSQLQQLQLMQQLQEQQQQAELSRSLVGSRDASSLLNQMRAALLSQQLGGPSTSALV